MLTFKQYIAEKWKRGFPNSEQFSRGHALHHEADVGKHKVKVIITHGSEGDRPDPKNVNVDFSVNHSFNKHIAAVKSPEEHMQILHHIHKVINHYVSRRKPERIRFAGNTDEKKAMYAKYADHLARKYKGKVTSPSFGVTDVHMDKNK